MLTERSVSIKKAKLHNLSLRISHLLKKATPYSYQEYFAYALRLALLSLKEGNFGVGTVIIFRYKETEYLIGGRNQVFSRKDSTMHADKDALQKFELLGQRSRTFDMYIKNGKINSDIILFKRPAPDDQNKSFLITTLESCAGCYQEILTHNTFGFKISQICSGREFPESGSEHPFRSKSLPLTWKRMAIEQNISIFSIWDPEVQYLCDDIFNFDELEVLQKNYLEENPPSMTNIIRNLKSLTK